MLIKRLKLVNWRNYREAVLELQPGVNVVCGDNARGKTNLLEAVSYLGLASSFRGAADIDLINREADYFYIEASLLREGPPASSHTISSAMDRRHRRKLLIDGIPCKRLADSVGFCHNVIFSPDDMQLIKGGPDGRRYWLNRQLSQTDPVYCSDLISYNRVLRQRNALLRNWEDDPQPELLQPFTCQLVELGSRIILRRAQAAHALEPLAVRLHQTLADGEKLTVNYRSRMLPENPEIPGKPENPENPENPEIPGKPENPENPGKPEKSENPENNHNPLPATKNLLQEIQNKYIERLERLEQAEYRRGTTLAGPHRDDIDIFINEMPAKDMASQGQQRTAAIALKLAELEWGRQQKGEYPILLLDDVLSELDDKRRSRILQLPEQVQTIITAAGNIKGFSTTFRIDPGAHIVKLK